MRGSCQCNQTFSESSAPWFASTPSALVLQSLLCQSCERGLSLHLLLLLASKRVRIHLRKAQVARRKPNPLISDTSGKFIPPHPFFVCRTDVNCICDSDTFANDVSSCVVVNCSTADAEAAVGYFEALCSGLSRLQTKNMV